HVAWTVERRLSHLRPVHDETVSAQNSLGWALYRRSRAERARSLLKPVQGNTFERAGIRPSGNPKVKCAGDGGSPGWFSISLQWSRSQCVCAPASEYGIRPRR